MGSGMTRDDTIKLARKAGVYSGANEMVFAASLERFAALIAAAKEAELMDRLTIAYMDGYEKGKNAGAAAIDALRERLARPEQEPLLWALAVNNQPTSKYKLYRVKANAYLEKERLEKTYPAVKCEVMHLYTAPQPRQWQGLTDEERLDAERLADQQYLETRGQELRPSWASLFYRAIEVKLKEKNT